MISILKFSMAHNSIKMLELKFLFSACCLMMLYNNTKFHESITKSFSIIEYFQTKIFKGA